MTVCIVKGVACYNKPTENDDPTLLFLSSTEHLSLFQILVLALMNIVEH